MPVDPKFVEALIERELKSVSYAGARYIMMRLLAHRTARVYRTYRDVLANMPMGIFMAQFLDRLESTPVYWKGFIRRHPFMAILMLEVMWFFRRFCRPGILAPWLRYWRFAFSRMLRYRRRYYPVLIELYAEVVRFYFMLIDKTIRYMMRVYQKHFIPLITVTYDAEFRHLSAIDYDNTVFARLSERDRELMARAIMDVVAGKMTLAEAITVFPGLGWLIYDAVLKNYPPNEIPREFSVAMVPWSIQYLGGQLQVSIAMFVVPRMVIDPDPFIGRSALVDLHVLVSRWKPLDEDVVLAATKWREAEEVPLWVDEFGEAILDMDYVAALTSRSSIKLFKSLELGVPELWHRLYEPRLAIWRSPAREADYLLRRRYYNRLVPTMLKVFGFRW